MELVIGKFSCDVDACLKLGKKKFIEQHTHLDNAEEIWEQIESHGIKTEKPTKTGKS